MEAIRLLREVIGKLTSEEKASIKTYLKVFVLDIKEKSNRGLQLYEYLISIENKKVSIEEMELAIYKKPNTPALKRLANRTKNKILEALITDINVDREGVYTKRTWVNIDVRKKLTQAQILHGRGLVKYAEAMFENVIELCNEYELYEEQLIGLRNLIKLQAVTEGDKQLNDLLNRYKQCDKAKDAMLDAELKFYRTTARTDFYSESKTDQKEVSAMLDKMRDDFKTYDSAHIGYYYYYIEALNYQQIRNYKKARASLSNIVKLVQNYPAIRTNERLLGALVNLADNDLYLVQFERTYTTAIDALPLTKKGRVNFEICVELMFYAKYYSGEYNAACSLLLEHIPKETNSAKFREGKRNYFMAAAFFMLKDYSTVVKMLSVSNPMEVDKEGWDIGIKILHILTAIELNQLDDATGKIEAMRKYFSYGHGADRPRVRLIHTLLQSLSYNGYNFKATFHEHKTSYEVLNDLNGECGWNIKSFEMVIFHQWFFAKVSNQNFIQEVGSFQLENQKA